MKKRKKKTTYIRHFEKQCGSYSKIDRQEFDVSKEIDYKKARKLAKDYFKGRFDTFTDVSNECVSKMSIVRNGYYKFVGFNLRDLFQANNPEFKLKKEKPRVGR